MGGRILKLEMNGEEDISRRFKFENTTRHLTNKKCCNENSFSQKKIFWDIWGEHKRTMFVFPFHNSF